MILTVGRQRAVVLFHDRGLGCYRRFLRRGFRHCALVLDEGDYWVGVDAGFGAPKVRVLADSRHDIASAYRETGRYHVQEIEFRRRPRMNGLAVRSCVSLVKELLCVRAWWVQTPFQLYRYLERKPR